MALAQIYGNSEVELPMVRIVLGWVTFPPPTIIHPINHNVSIRVNRIFSTNRVGKGLLVCGPFQDVPLRKEAAAFEARDL